jgi:hypothetical protein
VCHEVDKTQGWPVSVELGKETQRSAAYRDAREASSRLAMNVEQKGLRWGGWSWLESNLVFR